MNSYMHGYQKDTTHPLKLKSGIRIIRGSHNQLATLHCSIKQKAKLTDTNRNDDSLLGVHTCNHITSDNSSKKTGLKVDDQNSIVL
ncbi:Unannotated [Lentimonas sp. CC19]|nr:Unannotated [Lentimonas sp. CC10]CAA6693290.1 Unannotated [Lentimonas sp. CC19]CAA7068786.1 Unannotated [Lentimonas sp. CC11]